MSTSITFPYSGYLSPVIYSLYPSHQVNKILKEVRLCQVDGFITALSLLRAKMMIKNGQRPYAQIDAKFYAPLPDDQDVNIDELRKMTKAKYDALLARIHG